MTDDRRPADYGNWISADLMRGLDIASIGMMLLTLASGKYFSPPVTAVLGVVMVIMIMFTLYMQSARSRFAANDGELMRKFCELTLSKLPPSETAADEEDSETGEEKGPARILDAGTYLGGMAVSCTSQFDDVTVTGADSWDKKNSREQCEFNVRYSGMSDRIGLDEEYLSHMTYPDGTFDGVISCFGFYHSDKKQDRKRMLEESLRVLKKGGSFAMTDFFCNQSIYGDTVAYLEKLKQQFGLSEIYLIPNVEKSDFVPALLRAPWLLRDTGLIYGVK